MLCVCVCVRAFVRARLRLRPQGESSLAGVNRHQAANRTTEWERKYILSFQNKSTRLRM